LTQHPEIKQLINDYLSDLMLHKPEDVFKFTKNYFSILSTTPNIAKVLIVVGPSGVGKGTLIKDLMKEFPENFKFSVSHTTRSVRQGEKHGENYYFIAKDKFQQMIIKEEFIEYNKYNENYYGTSRTELERLAAEGNVCIIEIDINGAKALYKKGYQANYIGVLPPSLETLRERLKLRKSENTDQITKRLEVADEEIKEINSSPFFAYRVTNDHYETGYKDFKNAVMALYPQLKDIIKK